MENKLFTINEAAVQLGISATTLRRWDEQNIISSKRTIGNQRRYSKEDLDEIRLILTKSKPLGSKNEQIDLPLRAESMMPKETISYSSSNKDNLVKNVNYEYPFVKLGQQRKTMPLFLISFLAILSLLFFGAFAHDLGYGDFFVNAANRLAKIFLLTNPNKHQLVQSNNKAVLGVENHSSAASFIQYSAPIRFVRNANFLDTTIMQKGLTVKGLSLLEGGIKTNNKDIDAGTGKIFASNVVYTIKAGKNVVITGGQNPEISVSASNSGGVTSLQGVSGDVILSGGDDISIEGLKVSDKSTLLSIRARGGCNGCITPEDISGSLSISAVGSVDAGAIKSGVLDIAYGGTGASSADSARSNLGAAGSGANSDITSLTGLTSAIPLSEGGTGVTSLEANGVLYGNGPGEVQTTSSPNAGQVLIGNNGGTPTFTTISGILSLNGDGVTSINPGSIVLGTDTSGDYAAGVNSGSGIAVTGSGGAGSTPSFSLGSFTENWNQTGPFSLILNNTGSRLKTLGQDGTYFATLDVGTLDSDKTYVLPNFVGGSATICLSTGNCGSGGGGIGGSGTANRIAKFSDVGVIGDSSIYDNGSIGIGTVNPEGLFTVKGAPIGKALAVFNNTGSEQDILVASSAGITRFIIANNGTITIPAYGAGVVHTNASGTFSTGLVDINSEVTGILPLARGGTGITSSPANGQLLIGNGSGYTLGTVTAGSGISVTNGVGSITVANTGVTSLSGTANQVNVSGATGGVTLSLPQNIDNGASPTFNTVNLTSNTNQIVLGSGSTGTITLGSMTGARAYTFPDASGIVCLSSGNCPSSGGTVTGTGTVNYISKFTNTGSIGDSSLYDDGRVGIGTNNPQGLLHINGTGVGGSAAFIVNQTGGGDILSASAGGTSKFTIGNNGVLTTSYGLGLLHSDASGIVSSSKVDLANSGTDVTGTLPLGSGGTGGTTASQARTNLGAAGSGVNNDITQLTGLSTALAIGEGGTGITSSPANGQLLIGNGSGYTLGTVTAGSGISVTNGVGSITVANTGVTSLSGTANQVNVSGATGGVTLSLPQNIDNGASPTFNTVNLTSNTNQIVLGSGSTGTITLGSMTGARAYTFPDASGIVCLSSGNCPSSGGTVTGTGTVNYISKFTNTGSIGDSSLYDDGRVGIGTNNPQGLLHINGTGVGGSAAFIVNQTGGGDILSASAGGTSKFTIGNNGVLTTSYGLGLLHSDASGIVSSSKVDLANSGTDVTGTLPLGSGGTGGTTASQARTNLGAAGSGVNNDITQLTGLSTALAIGEGGTGITSSPANGQLLIGNGSGYTLGTVTAGSGISVTNGVGSITVANTGVTSLSGTANQVNVSGATGGVTLSLPQNIDNGASPTFNTVNLTSNTNQIVLGSGSTGTITLGSMTGARAYTFPDASGIVCLSTGNCSGVGGSIVGSGTVNYLAKFSNAGSIGDSSLYDDGRVGIGTNNPQGLLHINGTGIGGSAAFIVNQTGGGDILSASAGGTSKFTIGNNGVLTTSYGLGLLHSDASGIVSSSKVDLANSGTDVTGTLPLGSGGTGGTTASQARTNLGAAGSGVNNDITQLTGLSTALAIGEGGTGITSSPANGQLLIGNGSGYTLGTVTAGSGISVTNGVGSITVANTGVTSLSGTANQVNVSGATGGVTLSLPQNIDNGASPTFNTVNLTSNTNQIVLGSGSTGTITLGSMTGARAYTFPDASGIVCLSSGNCPSSGGTVTGTGTVNYISKFTNTGSIGDSSLYDDGRVGIGTNNPQGLLHINGTGIGGSAAFIVNQTGGGDILSASAGGVTLFTLQNNGDVVIGGTTTIQPGQLSVMSNSTGQRSMVVQAIIGQSTDLLDFYNSTGAFKAGYDPNGNWFSNATGKWSVTDVNAFQISNAGDAATLLNADTTNLRLGIGTAANLLGTLDVRTTSGILPVATISGATAMSSLLVDNSGTGDLFTASKSGASKLTILNNGNLQVNNFTTTGGLIYGGTSGVLGQIATGTSGQLLISNGAGTNPTWTDQSTLNYWDHIAGVLSSKNATVDDLLLGSNATTSAKIAFININSGTPTASISGNIVLNNNGSIQSTNNQSLIIGGNTTGNIILSNPVTFSNNLTLNGNTFASLTGNGLTAGGSNSLAIKLTTSGTGGSSSSNSGLELSGSGLTLLKGCVDGQLLKYTAVGGWACAADDGSGGGSSKFTVSGTVLYPNFINNQLGIGTMTGGDVISSFYVTHDLASGALGKALSIFNQTENQPIISASASGITQFEVLNNGTISFAGGTANLNTITSSASASRSYIFPDENGVVCLNTGNCLGVGGDITGVGTTNYLPKFSSTNSLTSSTIFDNGKIGIGTASPTSLFHVEGAITGKALTILNETGNQDIFTASASGTPVFTIAHNGNLTATGTLTGLTGLTVNSGIVTLPAGQIDNTELANSSITVSAGSGLSGGGSVSLGGTVTLTNAGVTSFQGSTGAVTLTAGSGIGIAGTTISNNGVTSLTGTANQVNVSGATGAVTLSLPQNIDTGATPSFNKLNVTSNTNQLVLGSGNTGTITMAALGAARTYTLPNVSGTFCLDSGNCAGTSAGIGGSGNSNYMAKFTGTYTIGASSIFDNGLVGIGTGAPQGQLHVSGGSTGGNAALIVNQTGAATNPILSASSSGVTKFTIANTGQLTAPFYGTGILHSNANGLISSSAVDLATADVTGTLGLGNGGTGATTAVNARANLSAAVKGVNNDITQLTGLTTALSVGQGGTGLGTAPTNGQLLIGNTAGGNYNLSTLTQGAGITVTNGAGSITIANAGVTSLTGTANQVNVSGATGAVTLSLPQNIHTGASPTFAGLNLTGNTNQLVLGSGNTGTITMAALGAARTYTLPNVSGTFCLDSGNCAGTSAGIGGSGNSNYMAKFTGTYTIGASSIFDNGLVGIGTGAPQGQLHVSGGSTGGNAALIVNQTGAATNPILSASSSGVTKFTIANTGQLTAPFYGTGILHSNANGLISSSAVDLATADVTGTLGLGNGGTGATTAVNARANLSAAVKGVNNDITQLTGLTTALSVGQGGTGLGTAPTNGQLLIGNTAGGNYNLSTLTQGAGITVTNGAGSITIANAGVTSLTGTANQVNVSGATGAVTLSLPQNIHTGASPTFAGLNLTGNTNQLVLGSGNTGTITMAALGAARTYTLPNVSGTFCLDSGNCAGTSAGIGGSGNSNYMAKFTGTYTIGVSSIFDNGLVGIGTGAPQGQLHVSGGSTGGNAALIVNQTGAATNPILSASSSGVTKFTIANTGQLTAPFYGTGILHSNANGLISSSAVDLATADVTGTLGLGNGGTGATTAVNARANLSAAVKGVNNDITQLTGLTTALSVGQGGTGLGTAPTNGQLLIGNTAGGNYNLSTLTQGAGITVTNGAGSITIANAGVTSLTGTANQVNVSGATGAVTLSLPQNIHTGASPTFAGLNLTGNTNQLVLGSGNTGTITMAALGAARTYTLPNVSGTFCLDSGNCAGTSAGIGGSGNSNYMAKFTGTYTIGVSSIFDNGLVGIGTGAPQGQLHVSGGSTGGNAALIVNQTGAATNDIFTASAAGTTKFIISNAGLFSDTGYGTGILHSNANGLISSSAVDLATADVTGSLAINRGGTGLGSTPTNGQLLIGNGTNYSLATLTQGSNMSIANGAGTITLATSATPSFTTVNGLTIIANADGFGVSGGTTSRLLTITGSNITLTGGGNTLTLTGSTTINQNLTTAATPTFNSLTLTNGLTAGALISANGGLTIASGQSLTLTSLTANNSALYATSGTGAVLAATTSTPGQCLLSGASAPSWGACTAVSNYWQLNSGIITPATLSNKLSIGVPTNLTSLATLDLRALSGIQPIASVSGSTSNAGIIVDNSGSGDIFSASSSGNTRFTIANSGNIISKSSSTTGFQLQDISGTSYFTADSVNKLLTTKNITIGNTNGTTVAGHIFTDSFEQHDQTQYFNGFTINGSSNATMVTSPVHSGAYAIQYAVNNGQDYINTTTVTGNTTEVIRAYVYVSTANPTALEFASLTSTTGRTFAITRTNGVNGVLAWSNNGTITNGSTVMTTGAWHKVELSVTISAGAGTATLYLDGNQVLTQSGINTGTGTFNGLQVGDTNAGHVGTYNLDDLVVDTVLTGDSGNLFVADTLHVGGYADFQGSIQINNGGNRVAFIDSVAGGFYSPLFSANTTSTDAIIQGGNAQNLAGSAGGGVQVLGLNGSATGSGGNGGSLTLTAGNGLGGNGNGGNIILSAGSSTNGTPGGVVVKNATNTLTSFQVQNAAGTKLFNIGTLGTGPVASISGQTSFAGLVVDNKGTGDLFTASKSGATKFVIANNGNVGIGTANPSASLDIAGGTIAGAGLSSDCSATNSKLLWSSSTKQFSCGTDRASVTITKSSDQTSSSTTLQNDNSLLFSADANSTYIVDIVLSANLTTGDMKWAFSIPSGASCAVNEMVTFSDSASAWGTNTSDCTAGDNWGNGTVVGMSLHIRGTFTTAGTPGTVTLRWAQNTGPSGTMTLLGKSSTLLAYKATGADLAEAYYTKDATIGSGDIVAIDGSLKTGVKKTEQAYDAGAVGIISTKPGQVLSDSDGGESGMPVLLALTGRVPVKVSSINGDIHAGDYLTSSSIAGVAMKATRAGQMIGKAMEDYTNADPSAIGKIIVFTNLTWADPVSVTDSGNISADGNIYDLTPIQLVTDTGITTSADLNTIISEFNKKISKISDLETRVASLESKLIDKEGLADFLVPIQSKLADQETKITSLQNIVASHESRMKDLESVSTKHENTLIAVSNKVTSHESEMKDMQLKVAGMQKALLGLQIEATDSSEILPVSNSSLTINPIPTIVKIRQSMIGISYDTFISSLSAHFATNSSVNNLTGELNDQQLNLQSMNERISSLESNISFQASQSAKFLDDIASSPFGMPVSSSGQLSLPALDVEDATVSGTLTVLGKTIMSDVGITGNITAGLLSIQGLDQQGNASINTFAGPLRLQSEGLNGVDLIDGKVVIDTQGNIMTKGMITTKKINIDTSDYASASIGLASIRSGQSQVVIKTSAVTSDSHIFTSLKTLTDLPLIISDIIPGKSFTVQIKDTSKVDLKFSWWVIN